MKTLPQPAELEFVATLAERVRRACLEAALAGYEDAAANGLCAAGAWEAAISAMQSLHLEQIVQAALLDQNSSR